jgi:putative long chain acyl-CoA synthase
VSDDRGGGLPGLRLAQRVRATARNVGEVVRFGGLDTGEESAPFDVVRQSRSYRLRHYFARDPVPDAPPIVLVPPLMLTAEVWDVSPSASAVTELHRLGLDVWVVDFGHPDQDPGGLERDLADHVLAVSDAVDAVHHASDRDVILSGYSQGGMFVYQAAALRHGKGIDSLVTFGAPVDASAPLPIPLSPAAASRLAGAIIDSGLLRRIAVPGWFSRLGFKLLTPAKSVRNRARFLLALHDREALLPRERQRRFLEVDGWTAWSGPAVANFLETYFQHNRILEGGFVIDDRLVTLADIDLPILTVVGSIDTIGHPDSVRAIRRAAPNADVHELTLRAGHFALVVGSTAMEHTWPGVVAWARWRTGASSLPDTIVVAQDMASGPTRPARGTPNPMSAAVEVGVGASRLLVDGARRAADAVRGVVSAVPAQLPRLQRLERLDPATRISLGLLLDEQADRAPDGICFLFGDRAHRYEAVKNRVDSVVRGLLEIGVLPGQRVGVLMSTRPSGFTAIAALSRLGATSVLLRPGSDVAREARLGAVDTVIVDPEHVGAMRELTDARCAVLGGGADLRILPDGVVDIERIDPGSVAVPAGFVANPHCASDVAFVVFTGEGASSRAVEITNKRWALSALGTATAAALRPEDTVYSVTPLHHSSALLMSIGGAITGGARFAMSTADDTRTFWDEVRRYGATHVSYTWTSLRAITYAPRNPSEQHNPIRMFIGSGMPRNLWARVAERFPDARVLEFYASAGGEAILANVTGQKPGSMGRPVPGAPEVRVAVFDMAARTLRLAADGYAREALADEIGVLLSRVSPADEPVDEVLRGVFTAGDAWRCTDDLFLRDQQGDHWLAGSVAEIVDTAHGPVLPAGARFCLGLIAAVDLIVVYGVPDDGYHAVVGAVTLRPQTSLDASDIDAAMERLPRRLRPRYVQTVRSLPMTAWHRPIWRTLQRKGVPTAARGRKVWRIDEATGHYHPLG